VIGRAAVAGFGALTALVVIAGPALAHVEVQPGTAAAGEPATFSFRVPNEEDNAATVSLTVHLPADDVIPSVQAAPKPGWSADVTADAVTWSGGRIEPGHAEYFTITTGPLPTDVDSLVFAADQTYSNGDVVSWNEPEVNGGAEPAHPAPVLQLTGAQVGVDPAPATTVDQVGFEPVTAGRNDDGAPVGLIVGIIAAAVVVVAGFAYFKAREPRRPGAHR
jgi:uncharacterized protein YcnI